MTNNIRIEFCSPEYGTLEKEALQKALSYGKLEGGGPFNKYCETIIRDRLSAKSVLMTPSCTASLEMMALVLNLGPGDEVIMPDFTFVSTANAFALRGATPVFVDVDPKTLNIDPAAVAAAITPKTKAVVAVHYAGVACEMQALKDICAQASIFLLEDAAQAYGSTYHDKPLGSFGAMSAFSFHHTKNLSCGEGGAIVANSAELSTPLEWIQEKGTDRASFKRREVKKYEWNCLGSSYLLSELAAAVLSAQLQKADDINSKRMIIWNRYAKHLGEMDDLILPYIPPNTMHNAHIFYIRLPTKALRDTLINDLRQNGIVATSHYIPLHRTVGGKMYARSAGTLQNTIQASETLVRLPLHSKLTDENINEIIGRIADFLSTG